MKDDKLKQLYFSHDIFADKDEKIVKMFYHFRKNIGEFSDDFIRKNFFHASFGLFWEIVQYLHRNELNIEEIPMLADELRADESFVRSIIEDFNLFRIEEDGKVVSDRILQNLNEVTQKSNKNREAVQIRWLLSAFDKYYEEFFEQKPILQPDEIEALKKYSLQIPDLKDRLRDILYTLKNLTFDKDIKFKPCANWLLKDNNLARLLNGEFGAIKHKKTEKEIKELERKRAEEEALKNQPSELDLKIESCSGKAEALEIILGFYNGKNPTYVRGKLFLMPSLRKLTEKFDITDKEIAEMFDNEE